MYVAKNSTPLFFHTAKTRLLLPHLTLITFVIVIITPTILISSSTGWKERRERQTDVSLQHRWNGEERRRRKQEEQRPWFRVDPLYYYYSDQGGRICHWSGSLFIIKKNLSSGIFRPSPQQKKLLGDPFLTQFLISRPPPVDPFLVFPTWRHCGPSSPPGSHRAV